MSQQQMELETFPITSRIIRGHFKWCANMKSRHFFHHLRIKGDTPSKKYLYLKWERPENIFL
jgi:hypothetical protein